MTLAPAKALKSPTVLIAGLLIGIVLLVFMSRGKGAASGPADYTLTSQQIAAGANVQLAAGTNDYNKAALQYMAAKAGIAAETYASNVNASTAVTMQAISSINNTIQTGAQLDLQRLRNAGEIALSSQQNAAYLEAARIAADTQIKLAPIEASIAERIANINAAQTVALARINSDAASTVASITAASRSDAARMAVRGQTTHDIISNVPGLIKMLPGFGGSEKGGEGEDSGFGELAQFAQLASIFV